ncbi:MAG: PAS domain S-box protein [Nitrospirota bacterium]
MIKSHKLWYEENVVMVAIIAGLVAWLLDAAFDSLLFSRESFFDSLILEVTPHELYFRLFIVLTLFIFSIVTARTLARRRHAEDELRKALATIADEKAKSEAVIAAIPDGISIQDRNYRILYQNEVHRSLVGDQLGKTCYEAYSERDTVCPGCPVARSFADGGNHVLEKQRETGNGTIFIEIHSSPLRNAGGEIVAGIEAVRDITERNRAEQRLKMFSQAINEAMDGVQIVGLDGKILYSNKAVEEIYGFTDEEFRGRDVNELNADREFAKTVIFPSIQKHGRWSGEVTVLHKNGRKFPVWLSTSFVKNDAGEPVSMVGIIRDITARRKIEEELKRHQEQLEDLVEERTAELKSSNSRLQREIAERERMEAELSRVQKLESLGLLAGGIAHDFNNLLGAIMGNISLAMLDVDPENSAYQQLTKAERASFRAQDLTRQLLTFSRGGAPVKKTITLPGIITEAAGFSLRGSRVLHELSIAADLWPVDADEGQMMQVFNNLLINADQAMPAGGIIRIAAGNVTLGPGDVPSLAAGRYVRVTVSDQGTGIPREHLGKIFDPYFTTKQKGSGLGLAATYSIIRKHDGHIIVASELGKGTVFHIYLPASQGEVTLPPRQEKLVRGRGAVLIMDDDEDMRKTTGDMLIRMGYTVDYADEGNAAIARYRQAREAGRPFAAVIMDLTVPGGMGGKEAIGKLLAIDPAVRAIVSSGYSEDPVMADFRAYGFRGVAIKPYRIRELSEVIAAVIGSEGG